MVKATRRDADESSVADLPYSVYSLSLLETSLESLVRRSIVYIQPLNDLRNFSYRETRAKDYVGQPNGHKLARSRNDKRRFDDTSIRRTSKFEKRKRSNLGKTKRTSTYVSLTSTASGSPANVGERERESRRKRRLLTREILLIVAND